MTKLKHILFENISDVEKQYPSSGRYVYRGVSERVALSYAKGKYLATSLNEQMPFDPVVVEMMFGEDYSEMSQEDIDSQIQSVCSWYDGSGTSVKGGLNTVSSIEIAKDYAGDFGFILVLKLISNNYCNFTDEYVYVKSTKDVNLEAIYEVSTEKLYKPDEFVKKFTNQ